MKALTLCLIFLWIATFTALAEEVRSVIIAAPSAHDDRPLWPVLSFDGSQLYDRVYAKVFGLSGIRVELKPVPEKRALMMVREGQADFFPGEKANLKFEGYAYVAGSYAVWYSEGFAAIFKKSVLSDWNGPLSLKGLKIVHCGNSSLMTALAGYHEVLAEEIAGAYELSQPGQALKMLIFDRVDVYIDTLELVGTVAIPANQDNFNSGEYQIELLGRQKFYPLFQNSSRGRKLAQLFDRGMEELARSGELHTLYESYDYSNLNNMDPDLLRLKESREPSAKTMKNILSPD